MKKTLLLTTLLAATIAGAADARTIRTYPWVPVQTDVQVNTQTDSYHHDHDGNWNDHQGDWRDHRDGDRDHHGDDRDHRRDGHREWRDHHDGDRDHHDRDHGKHGKWHKKGKCPPGHHMKGEC